MQGRHRFDSHLTAGHWLATVHAWYHAKLCIRSILFLLYFTQPSCHLIVNLSVELSPAILPHVTNRLQQAHHPEDRGEGQARAGWGSPRAGAWHGRIRLEPRRELGAGCFAEGECYQGGAYPGLHCVVPGGRHGSPPGCAYTPASCQQPVGKPSLSTLTRCPQPLSQSLCNTPAAHNRL